MQYIHGNAWNIEYHMLRVNDYFPLKNTKNHKINEEPACLMKTCRQGKVLLKSLVIIFNGENQVFCFFFLVRKDGGH